MEEIKKLITDKLLLEKFPNKEICYLLDKINSEIDHIKLNMRTLPPIGIEQASAFQQQLNSTVDLLLTAANGLKDDIDNALTKEYISHRYITKYMLEYETNIDSIKNNRRFIVTEDIKNVVSSTISTCVNWKFPALVLGCREPLFLQDMVAADPLYFVDQFESFIQESIIGFNDIYKGKIKKYHDPELNFDLLPKKQFSAVISFNLINYWGLQYFDKQLPKIAELIRPGGSFIFTYNNLETLKGIEQVEKGYMSGIPKSHILNCIQNFDFYYSGEISFVNNQNFHLMILKKRGQLSSVKAHPVMGELVRRPN